MKKVAVLLFVFSCSCAVWAQSVSHGSVSEDDRISVVPKEKFPVPPPPKEGPSAKRLSTKQAGVPEKDIDGVSFTGGDDGTVKALEQAVREIQDAKRQARTKDLKKVAEEKKIPGLVFDAKDLPLTLPVSKVPEGELVGAIPSGTFKDGRWTGITRYFKLNDGTLIELTERDLHATRGRLFMSPANINTEIKGKPARAAALYDSAGRKIRQVVWVNGPKFYELYVLSPEVKTGGGDAVKKAAPVDHSAISYARAVDQP